MSVRFGVALIPEPAFTARVYRARQLICGQYATWAAEMHMLHLTVADFFECPENSTGELDSVLSEIAERTRGTTPQYEITNRGIATFPDVAGHIFLDFATARKSEPIYSLHRDVMAGLGQVPGLVRDLRFSGDAYWPHITLMQRADLPPAVFEAAVQFSAAVVDDLHILPTAKAWQLTLARFESDAAGADWDDGGWAADLRWKILNSYPL